MKRIILCADDFGQSTPISEGILQLVRAGRLSAVSCMTEAESWREHGAELTRHGDTCDIGLHFNLTHPLATQSYAAQSLSAVLTGALSGRLDGAAIAAALHAQLDRFEEVAGRAPDFVDGHQHVHVFPGIRGTLLRELGRRYSQRKPYLRNVDPRLPNPLGDRSQGIDAIKIGVLKLLNIGFARAARRHGLACTRGFGGIYSLRPTENFADLMQGWLATAQTGDLVMCHPGVATSGVATSGVATSGVDTSGVATSNTATSRDAASAATDPIAATRPRELQHLSSPDFAAQLRSADVVLSRFERGGSAL